MQNRYFTVCLGGPMSHKSCWACSRTIDHDKPGEGYKPPDEYCLSMVRVEDMPFWRAGWEGRPFSGTTREAQAVWQKGVLARERKNTEELSVDPSRVQSVAHLFEAARPS
jgi:hypothetical protein